MKIVVVVMSRNMTKKYIVNCRGIVKNTVSNIKEENSVFMILAANSTSLFIKQTKYARYGSVYL